MDKKSISQRKRESLNSLGAGKQAVEAVEKRAIDVAWVRADGAICFGNECVVIKPEPGGKNLESSSILALIAFSSSLFLPDKNSKTSRRIDK